MYEIKVTPDNGARYTVTVERDGLQSMLNEVGRRIMIGEVSFFTVRPIYVNVGA